VYILSQLLAQIIAVSEGLYKPVLPGKDFVIANCYLKALAKVFIRDTTS
jgi:hypothetical protein